jgi:hypothetical protein
MWLNTCDKILKKKEIKNRKMASAITKIMNNKDVYKTVILTLKLSSYIFASLKITWTGIIEMITILSPEITPSKKDENIFNIITIILTMGTFLPANILRYEKVIGKESTFFKDILDVKFDGDFEKFEEKLDELFDKEIDGYVAEDFVALFCILTDILIDVSDKKIVKNTFKHFSPREEELTYKEFSGMASRDIKVTLTKSETIAYLLEAFGNINTERYDAVADKYNVNYALSALKRDIDLAIIANRRGFSRFSINNKNFYRIKFNSKKIELPYNDRLNPGSQPGILYYTYKQYEDLSKIKSEELKERLKTINSLSSFGKRAGNEKMLTESRMSIIKNAEIKLWKDLGYRNENLRANSPSLRQDDLKNFIDVINFSISTSKSSLDGLKIITNIENDITNNVNIAVQKIIDNSINNLDISYVNFEYKKYLTSFQYDKLVRYNTIPAEQRQIILNEIKREDKNFYNLIKNNKIKMIRTAEFNFNDRFNENKKLINYYTFIYNNFFPTKQDIADYGRRMNETFDYENEYKNAFKNFRDKREIELAKNIAVGSIIFTIRASYPIIKFFVKLIPKKIAAIMFDEKLLLSYFNEIIGFIGGFLLGPKYLSQYNLKTTTIKKILKEETLEERIDPVVDNIINNIVTKIPEKYAIREEKKDPYSIMKDIDDIALKEEIKRLGGSTVKTMYRQKNMISEKNKKYLQKDSLLRGSYAGMIITKNVEIKHKFIKKDLHKFLCKLSKFASVPSETISNSMNITLAISYLCSRLTGVVFTHYTQYKKQLRGVAIENLCEFVKPTSRFFIKKK